MLNVKSTYFGYTNNLKPMQKAKVENLLNQTIRSNGKYMLNKEFMYNNLINNYTLHIEENISHYSRKLDDYTKPKTEYRLKDSEGAYYTISKTLYDYGIYLLENNFIDETIASNYIEEELKQIEEEKQRQLQQEQLEKEQKEAEEKAIKEFEQWIDIEINNYSNVEKFNLAKEIFLQELGQYAEYQLKKLLVLIENIDKPLCKDKLISWLHSGNRTSKKVFYHVTGIKLATTDKATKEILNSISSKDYIGSVAYKKRKDKTEATKETFYKGVKAGNEFKWEEVLAEPLNKYGLEMFVLKINGKYSISEAKTGILVVSGISNKTELNKALKETIDRIGIDKINNIINETIEKQGISPKYNLISAS